ncbi:HAMP domain-containing histidine kinase [Methylobacterium sp. C25]|uniref:sensor histidine kinase n=1 Tax=Methylobacterium sp. C25 TaxID=2721622 RepID=UPI001F23275A|nr:HAMP domain-containing sensor histidine kinase [Methylobacterium sp. C25]MCE4226812.1 HAMP domain-containing histidine kinase [Methylobacterium sp. C25]
MTSFRRLIASTGFRFALFYTAAFVLSVAVIGWLVHAAVSDALNEQVRDRVDQVIAELTDEFIDGGRPDLDAALTGRLTRGEVPLHYAVIETDGRVVTGSPTLAAYKRLAGVPARFVPDTDRPDVTVVAAAQPLSDGTTLVVTDDLKSVRDVQAILGKAFAVALAAALLLGSVLGVFMSGAMLKRVDNVSRTAEAIIAGDFGRRVPTTGSGDDFDRLARTLNQMLDRIGGLMNNLRQVSNDIAHDLRTPLTRLRQGLQSVNDRASTAEEFRGAIDRASGEIDEILDVFAALLRIAQVEGGTRRAGFRAVDLSAVTRTVADAYGPAIEDGGRQLVLAIAPDVRINGDKELLTQLLANLCENALHHTPAGARIEIGLHVADHIATLSVADDGPGISAFERNKVFQRFYRVEKSRGMPGNGLGLTLVAAIAELHGRSVNLSDNEPGLRVTVAFPVLAAEAAGAIATRGQS